MLGGRTLANGGGELEERGRKKVGEKTGMGGGKRVAGKNIKSGKGQNKSSRGTSGLTTKRGGNLKDARVRRKSPGLGGGMKKKHAVSVGCGEEEKGLGGFWREGDLRGKRQKGNLWGYGR